MTKLKEKYSNSAFKQKSKNIYQTTLERILIIIYHSYQDFMADKSQYVVNNEDKITGKLVVDYLENDEYRKQYHFEEEFRFVSESTHHNEITYGQDGYSDIRVIIKKSINEFISTKSDYIIECKRLDGKVGIRKDTIVDSLNDKYVKNGIKRFINEIYNKGSVHQIHAMIGFCVKKFDTRKNIQEINKYLDTDTALSSIEELTHPNFHAIYQSKHKSLTSNEIQIFHLMLDFSSKIQS